ncbi:MAG TPA: pirin family protein [Iamia sp.]
MSGPLATDDVSPEPEAPVGPRPPTPPTALAAGFADRSIQVEITDSRDADVGGMLVRRALPRRARRTVGAWCFVDHLAPAPADGPGIGPHPHIGLHTVTWLLSGELVHHDSLGSEQPIRPGQLNVMSAGNGIAHAEETAVLGALHHGVQLWVAQPEATRWGTPAFAHHAELPHLDLATGAATVLVGSLDGATSPARADTPLVGAELDLRTAGASTVPLDPTFEHAVVVLEGAVALDGQDLTPGHLGYLGLGRDELTVSASGPTKALLVGGAPFEAVPLMWWNYVARSWDEVRAAHEDWESESDRFGVVPSSLARIPSLPPIRR